MLDTLYSQIGLLPMILVGVFAFWKGDEAERFAMGIYLLGWMAGMLVQDDGGLTRSWQWPLFLLDLMMLLVFAGLGWKSRKTWPVWAASLQLLIVMSHFVFMIDLRQSVAAFYTVLNIASYGILVCIGVGTFWAWQDRRAQGLE